MGLNGKCSMCQKLKFGGCYETVFTYPVLFLKMSVLPFWGSGGKSGVIREDITFRKYNFVINGFFFLLTIRFFSLI